MFCVFFLTPVVSDDNEEGQKEYLHSAHGNWLTIPYDSPLRNELKVKYGICAAKEQQAVGVDPRRNGIPTLLGKKSLSTSSLSAWPALSSVIISLLAQLFVQMVLRSPSTAPRRPRMARPPSRSGSRPFRRPRRHKRAARRCARPIICERQSGGCRPLRAVLPPHLTHWHLV